MDGDPIHRLREIRLLGKAESNLGMAQGYVKSLTPNSSLSNDVTRIIGLFEMLRSELFWPPVFRPK